MNSLKPLIGILTVILQWIVSDGANVLVLLPFSPPSQKIAFDVLVQELAERNHTVTYVTMFKPSKQLPGVTTVLMDGKLIEYFDQTTEQMFNTASFSLSDIPKIGERLRGLCDLILQDENMLKFIKTSTKTQLYDVTLTNSIINECYLHIAHKIGAPVILLSVPVLFPTLAWTLDIPNPLSYVPMMILAYNYNMTFTQRLKNFAVAAIWHVVYNYAVLPITESAVRRHFPDVVGMTDVVRNASLLLVNTHFSLDGPRPTTPRMIEIGCIHCNEGKKLPKVLEEFVERTGDEGFIVFSLGSIVKGRYMSPQFVNAWVEAFAQIKQRVLWKYEKPLKGLSPNVLTQSWLPQQDLMGLSAGHSFICTHPKCKMAITHGGILSLQEVAYHGVPLLGVPLGVDRIKNINDATNAGFALSLDEWDNLTAASLVAKINELIHNPRYLQQAEKLSSLMKDRPEHPLKTAAFWVEYVIRHKGAPHLRRSTQHLNTFQYFLIDVFAFIIGISVLLVVAIYKFIQLIYRYLFKQGKTKVVPNRKIKKR